MTTYFSKQTEEKRSADNHYIRAYLEEVLTRFNAHGREIPLHLRKAFTEEDKPGVSLEQAVESYGRLIILGKAGAGKTSLAKKAVLHIASRSLRSHFGAEPGKRSLSIDDQRIPVLVQLQSLESVEIHDMLASAFQQAGITLPDEEFPQRVVENFPLLLVLDGLDEIRPDIKLEAAAEIASLVSKPGSANRFVITCKEDEFPLYRVWFERCEIRSIEPINESQIRLFLEDCADPKRRDRVLSHPRAFEVLSTTKVLILAKQELDDTRSNVNSIGDLVLASSRKLLMEAESKKRNREGFAGAQSRTLMKLLAALAFSLKTDSVKDLSRDQARGIVSASSGDSASSEQLLEVLLSSGIIESSDSRRRIKFRDELTLEVFAAYAISIHLESGGDLKDYISDSSKREKWGGVVSLLYGIHSDKEKLLSDILGDGQSLPLVRLAVTCITQNEPEEKWSYITSRGDLDAQAHYYLGRAFADFGFYAHASNELNRAIEKKLDSADVHYQLGKIHEAEGKYELACQAVRASRREGPL